MSRVLLTGASGFLGRRLVSALLTAGHTVVAAARTLDGLPAGVEGIHLDLTDPQTLRNLPAEVDVIVHAAAARSKMDGGVLEISGMIQTNLLGTLNILDYAQAHHVKKVVYCSTLAVYALPQPVPISEAGLTYPVETLDSYYGISKLGGEMLCERYRQEGRFACSCLRLGRVYGSQEQAGSLLKRWVSSAQRSEEILVYGDGVRSLDFIYIEDAVRGIVAAVESGSDEGILNLSSGVETPWRTLAETIVQLFSPPGNPSRIRTLSGGNKTRCCLDVTRVRTALGFSSRYSLSEGLLAWREAEVLVIRESTAC